MQPQPTNIVIDKIENGYLVVFRGKVIFHESRKEALDNIAFCVDIVDREAEQLKEALEQAQKAQEEAAKAEAKKEK